MKSKRISVPFGRSIIPKESKNGCSANYESKNWSQLSTELSIAMYDTFPGTKRSIELPSVTLNLKRIIIPNIFVEKGVCPDCGLPMNEHELRPEFIEKIERREKNKPIRIRDIRNRLINQ